MAGCGKWHKEDVRYKKSFPLVLLVCLAAVGPGIDMDGSREVVDFGYLHENSIFRISLATGRILS